SGVVKTDAGTPVARAQACAHPITRVDAVCARSGADGKYTIDERADLYRVDVEGPPGGKLVPQWAGGATFEDNSGVLDARTADVPDVDFALEAGVVLRGTVRVAGAKIEDAQLCTSTLAATNGWSCESTDTHAAASAPAASMAPTPVRHVRRRMSSA